MQRSVSCCVLCVFCVRSGEKPVSSLVVPISVKGWSTYLWDHRIPSQRWAPVSAPPGASSPESVPIYKSEGGRSSAAADLNDLRAYAALD